MHLCHSKLYLSGIEMMYRTLDGMEHFYSKLYLSGIEMHVSVRTLRPAGGSKLYLSGIEISHHILIPVLLVLQIVP